MKKEELNEIINKYYSYDNLLETKFNIKEDEKFDLIIVCPTWRPHFVFDDEYKIEKLKEGSVSSYRLTYKDKKILFLKIGKGAPYMYDNLLLLRNLDANYIFLGSAGSLKENILIGDIVIPNSSISGDGASLYFNNKLDGSGLFNKIKFNEELINRIKEISESLKITIKTGDVYSTDTLIGEYYHLESILNMNLNCIEQETAAFGKCMQIMEKNGLPILVISDSLLSGQNYYEPIENKKQYIYTRGKKLQKIINRLY